MYNMRTVRDFLQFIPSDNGRIGELAKDAYLKHRDVFTFEQVSVVATAVYAMALRNEAHYIHKVISFAYESELSLRSSLQYYYDTEIKLNGDDLEGVYQGIVRKTTLIYNRDRVGYILSMVLMFTIGPLLYMSENYLFLALLGASLFYRFLKQRSRMQEAQSRLECAIERREFKENFQKDFIGIIW